jgi:hypothetical protein
MNYHQSWHARVYPLPICTLPLSNGAPYTFNRLAYEQFVPIYIFPKSLTANGVRPHRCTYRDLESATLRTISWSRKRKTAPRETSLSSVRSAHDEGQKTGDGRRSSQEVVRCVVSQGVCAHAMGDEEAGLGVHPYPYPLSSSTPEASVVLSVADFLYLKSYENQRNASKHRTTGT